MSTIIKYIGVGVITFLAFVLVEKSMPNLEITEEHTLFIFASLYLNIINLINHQDLEDQVKINHVVDTAVMKEVCGEERCKKAAAKVHKEYLDSMGE